jgi:hypothetical protein
MPVLQSANGTFDIAPANSSFNCDAFDAYKKNNVIKNDYRCNGTHSDPSATAFNSAIPSASSTSGGDNNNTPTNQPSDLALSTGGKAGIAVGAVAGVAALAGGALMLFLRRRKQQKAASLKSVDGAEKFEKAEKDGNAIGELHHNAVPYIEMPNGGEAQELPAGHGVSEVTEGRNVQGRNIHEIPGTHELQS